MGAKPPPGEEWQLGLTQPQIYLAKLVRERGSVSVADATRDLMCTWPDHMLALEAVRVLAGRGVIRDDHDTLTFVSTTRGGSDGQ